MRQTTTGGTDERHDASPHQVRLGRPAPEASLRAAAGRGHRGLRVRARQPGAGHAADGVEQGHRAAAGEAGVPPGGGEDVQRGGEDGARALQGELQVGGGEAQGEVGGEPAHPDGDAGWREAEVGTTRGMGTSTHPLFLYVHLRGGHKERTGEGQ